MSTIRDSLQYQPSPYSVTDHAAEADAILEACKKEWPKLLPYLLEPSNLLALGGLRGLSPYVTFGAHDKMARSGEFAAFLHRFGLRLILEQSNYGPQPDEHVYSLIHTGALEVVGDQYEFAKNWWAPKPLQYDYFDYFEWYMHNLTTCAHILEKGKLPKGWLAEWWAPHNICFGMLLGYPGVAICSAAAADMVHKSLGVLPDMLEVEFMYPENDGAKVAYYIQKADAGSRQIAAHQKRWQQFFDMLYAAWPPTKK